MKKIKALSWSILYYMIALCCTLGVSVGAGVIIAVMGQMNGAMTTQQELTDYITKLSADKGFTLLLTGTVMALFIAIFGVLYLVGRKNRKRVSVKETFGHGKGSSIALLALGAQGLASIIMILINIVAPKQVEAYVEMVSVIDGSDGYMLATLLLTVIVGPIAEEFVFRGTIYRDLRKGFAVFPAMLITSVLFGIYHMNLVQGVYVIPFSMAACYIYEKTKSLWGSIAFHVIFNGFSYAMSSLMELFSVSTQSIIQIIYTVIGTGMFIFGFIKIVRIKEIQENEYSEKI